MIPATQAIYKQCIKEGLVDIENELEALGAATDPERGHVRLAAAAAMLRCGAWIIGVPLLECACDAPSVVPVTGDARGSHRSPLPLSPCVLLQVVCQPARIRQPLQEALSSPVPASMPLHRLGMRHDARMPPQSWVTLALTLQDPLLEVGRCCPTRGKQGLQQGQQWC